MAENVSYRIHAGRLFNRFLLLAVLSCLNQGCLMVSPYLDKNPSGGKIRLLFYDSTGHKMTARQAKNVITNGKQGWENDVRVDSETLQVLERGKAHALYEEKSGLLCFNLLDRPTALAVNWPTATRGYSLLVLDEEGRGFSAPATVNFTYQAAKGVLKQLKKSLGARPRYRGSPAFKRAYDSAKSRLKTAEASKDPALQGKEGQLALDDLAVATDLLLEEYGMSLAKAHLKERKPWLGLTLNSDKDFKANLTLASQITRPYGWVRIVFDPGNAPSHYRDLVAFAKSKGLKVLGQPVDSAWAKNLSREAYLKRFQDYVQAFPQVDAWEIANECNGEWVPPRIKDEIADTAAHVKARTHALSVLTLYWQIGSGGGADPSMFNWVRANLPSSTRRNLDVVLVSAYIEGSPLGLPFDQVMDLLHREFPRQQIGIGEMDYWSGEDGNKAWWAQEEKDPQGEGRRAVAEHYYKVGMGYPYAVGGVFWWYFIQEMNADPKLCGVLQKIAERLR